MFNCGYKYRPLAELKIYSRIVCSSLFLREDERVVLLFILDRTIGWHNVWETISTTQFANGVITRRRGCDVVAGSGTALTSDQVNAALTRLERRGAIEAETFRGKVAYKIEEHWCHPDLEELGMWELNDSDFDYEEDTGGE